MQAGEAYHKLGDVSADGDLVMVINQADGMLFSVKDIISEFHEDTNQRTIWIEVEEM